MLVRELSEQVTFTYEGYPVDSWSKDRVRFDLHESVVTALTEALEAGRTGDFLDERPTADRASTD